MIAKFELNASFLRPVINVNCMDKVHLALIDTGAKIPVFTLGTRGIANFNGRITGRKVGFSGFGGWCDGMLCYADVDLGSFRYVDLPMVCIYEPKLPFTFVFSATMFMGFRYIIDDRDKVLIINTRTDSRELRFGMPGTPYEVHILVNDTADSVLSSDDESDYF